MQLQYRALHNSASRGKNPTETLKHAKNNAHVLRKMEFEIAATAMSATA